MSAVVSAWATLDGDPWREIDSVPADREVDVFYVNPSFDPPASGVLRFALAHEGMYVSIDGRCVPGAYARLWKDAGAELVLGGD